MTHKLKESEFKPPVAIEPINGFSKQEMDLINKYCKIYGYHPDFKSGLIYDGQRCHKANLEKESDGNIYAVSGDIRENINSNFAYSKYVSGRLNNLKDGRFFDKGISDVFGLISLSHYGG